ncbi:MAG: putative flagellar biosynthetic protein flhb [Fibrobacterota bacterium]|jgi:flagellar biosynthetic protein FlhB
MDEDEKTEEPTSKRMDEAREKGQLPKSQDLLQATTLLFGVLALWITGVGFIENMKSLMVRTFRAIPTWTVSDENLTTGLAFGLLEMLLIMLPVLLAIIGSAVAVTLAMVGFVWTSKLFDPDFASIFSLDRFAQLVSKRAFVELLKGVAKIVVVAWVAWLSVQKSIPEFASMAAWPFLSQVTFTIGVAFWAVVKMAIVLMLVGLADFFWQKHENHKKLKMTKQEVKDEARQSEGDPQVRNKRRRMRAEMHKRFSIGEVPKATVVITNPTHFSVALRFVQGVDAAPVVVAKGADHLAFRIREIARESGVPLVENPPVARALFARSEPGDAIPAELYAAVAEVLAFVMRARG